MDLARRKSLETLNQTPPNVGPGTYTLIRPSCKYRDKNYAPFFSSSKRVTIKPIIYNEQIYDTPLLRSKIQYGNSLQFTAPRNTFDIRLEQTNEEVLRKPQILQQKPKGKSGRILLCRVPLTVGVSAPSIPGRKDANGYDISPNNNLIKKPPTDYDTTLGPAFYNVPNGELCSNSLRYSGCTWSKMKGQRTQLGANNHPGPSDYDVKFVQCAPRQEDEEFRELSRKCCNVIRHTCMLICEAKRQNMPGPGYYEVVDMNKLGKIKYLSMKPKPFITTTKRKFYEIPEGPGPADYLVCDCFKRRKDYSLKTVPFYKEAPRFSNNNMQGSPGPGDYNVSVRKCHRYNENKHPAPFTTSAPRKTIEITSITPDPGQYDVPLSGVGCCPQENPQKTSVFNSRVCRFPRLKKKDVASPASYDIGKAYKFSNGPQSHAKGKRASFNHTEQKFSRIYDFAGTAIGMDSPGVGKYNISNFPINKGKTIPISLRFPDKAYEKRPGPLTYTLHPIYSEAMYRPKTSNNVRLMKNVANRLAKDPLNILKLRKLRNLDSETIINDTWSLDYVRN